MPARTRLQTRLQADQLQNAARTLQLDVGPTLHALPAEIKGIIVEHLMLEPNDEGAVCALRSLARLNRVWRAATAPVFYEVVRLADLVEKKDDQQVDRLTSAVSSFCIYADVMSIELPSRGEPGRTVEHCENAFKALREIDGWNGRLDLRFTEPSVGASMLRGFHLMNNKPRNLSLCGTQWRGDFDHDISRYLEGSNLVVLRLSELNLGGESDYQHCTILDCLCDLKQLKALSIGFCRFSPCHRQARDKFAALRYLAFTPFDANEFASKAALNELLARSGSTLETLFLQGEPMTDVISGLAWTVKLDTLMVVPAYWRNPASFRALRYCSANVLWPCYKIFLQDVDPLFDVIDELMEQDDAYFSCLEMLLFSRSTTEEVVDACEERAERWRGPTELVYNTEMQNALLQWNFKVRGFDDEEQI